MPKIAGLYFVPSKSYSKNSHTHGLFGCTIVIFASKESSCCQTKKRKILAAVDVFEEGY
jgi:hypothetical protein